MWVSWKRDGWSELHPPDEAVHASIIFDDRGELEDLLLPIVGSLAFHVAHQAPERFQRDARALAARLPAPAS